MRRSILTSTKPSNTNYNSHILPEVYYMPESASNSPDLHTDSIASTIVNGNSGTVQGVQTIVSASQDSTDDGYGSIHTRSFYGSGSSKIFNPWVRQLNNHYDFERYDGELNIYVSTSGSDSNDGLSSSNPVRTLREAFGLLNRYWTPYRNDIVCRAIIHLAAGTYIVGSSIYPPIRNTFLILEGASSGTTTLKTSVGSLTFYYLVVQLYNLTFNQEVIFSPALAQAVNCHFTKGIFCSMGGSLHVLNNCSFGSSSTSIAALLNLHDGSSVYFGNLGATSTITMNGNITDYGTLFASGGSNYYIRNAVFRGSVTGRKYFLSSNAGITTHGKGESIIPGTLAGTRDTACFVL